MTWDWKIIAPTATITPRRPLVKPYTTETLNYHYLCCRTVGDDDGGKMFNEQEYEEYKKRVIPQVWSFNNIVYNY